MVSRVEVNWLEDSSGRRTCHYNVKGMAVDTYVGELVLKNDDEGRPVWHARLKSGEEKGPFKTLPHAERWVEESVNGEKVES